MKHNKKWKSKYTNNYNNIYNIIYCYFSKIICKNYYKNNLWLIYRI